MTEKEVNELLDDLQENDTIRWNDEIYYVVVPEKDSDHDIRVVSEEYYTPEYQYDHYTGDDYSYMNVYIEDWDIVARASECVIGESKNIFVFK